MKQAIIVGIGGGLGSMCRYWMSGLILSHSAGSKFPFGTFCVNILGCVVIGALAALVEHRPAFSPEARNFLFTGILGGFTTFSAFALEDFNLLRRSDPGIALLYSILSVVCGVLAVAAVFKLTAAAFPAAPQG